MTGGTPHVSTAEVALDFPFHLPLPAPMISTWLKTDFDLETYKVLSDFSSFLKGALSNLRPRQCPSAALFSERLNDGIQFSLHLNIFFGSMVIISSLE